VEPKLNFLKFEEILPSSKKSPEKEKLVDSQDIYYELRKEGRTNEKKERDSPLPPLDIIQNQASSLGKMTLAEEFGSKS